MPVRAQGKETSKAIGAAQLYEEAQNRLNIDDYDAAIRYLQQASDLDPQNQEYLSAHGSLLAETGRKEKAIQVLQTAVQRFPNLGFEKYMYLGQLLEGEAAISNLQNGIHLLEQEAVQEVDREEAAELKAQLASGLCSLAEMHMACDGPLEEVADKCEALLSQAKEADASSPEPAQVLASLRNEQGRPDEALQHLRESMNLWFRQRGHDRPEADDGTGASPKIEEEAAEEGEEMEEVLSTPSFEFRFETAKLLIELDETTEDAVQILEDLLQENDQAVDVYYLLAMSHHAGGDDEAALATLEEGEALLTRLQVPQDDPSVPGFAQLKERIQISLEEATRTKGV